MYKFEIEKSMKFFGNLQFGFNRLVSNNELAI